MKMLRAFFLSHARMAAGLIALALCMKALMPAGYMLGGETRSITVQICADTLGAKITKQIVLAGLTYGTQNHANKGADGAKTDTPCAFAALGHGALGGADPFLLALALLFVLALGYAPQPALAAMRGHYLRPPLRGPPMLG